MDDAKKQKARVRIDVEFEIVDAPSLHGYNITEDSDGEITVWNNTDEEAALRVLTDLAIHSWTHNAAKVGLGHGFGLQTRVLPSDDH